MPEFQVQQDHSLNNESGFYSRKMAHRKEISWKPLRPQVVLGWGGGMLVLSVAAYRLLPLPVRLRTQSMDTVKFPRLGRFLPSTGPASPAEAVAGRVPSRFATSRPVLDILASQMVVNIFPTLVCFLCLQCSLAPLDSKTTTVVPENLVLNRFFFSRRRQMPASAMSKAPAAGVRPDSPRKWDITGLLVRGWLGGV